VHESVAALRGRFRAMCGLKNDLVAVGFCADEARLTAVLGFLLEEEVFELDDLEGIIFLQQCMTL